ncbi:MAG: glycosyltransferase [Erysipelotrichaceae bacterium]
MEFNILFPVYNEEKRIKKGIIDTYKYLSENNFSDFILTIIDNGSTDKTSEIAQELTALHSNIEYLKIESKGVGIAFKEGVLRSKSEIVGYMDIDLSTDVSYLLQVKKLFEQDSSLEIINGSRFNKDSSAVGRKWYRNLTSYGLIYLLKICLGMKASDAICGFKFFKQDVAISLISKCSEENGWFFLIEILLRAERDNLSIYELPVNWVDDIQNSSVNILQVTYNYLKHILKLMIEFKKQSK